MDFDFIEIAGVSFSALCTAHPALCNGARQRVLDLPCYLRQIWIERAPTLRESALRRRDTVHAAVGSHRAESVIRSVIRDP
jgi:hypothetical protein